jgi:hypothetical protein
MASIETFLMLAYVRRRTRDPETGAAAVVSDLLPWFLVNAENEITFVD